MADIKKTKRDEFIAGGVLLVFLTGYTLLAGLSLLIPLLLTAYGFHLYFFRQAGVKRFLCLGLLLVSVAALANGMTNVSHFSAEYIPIAAVAMLTMLLFKDLQLAFSMSFISAAIVSLMIGAGVDYMLTVFIGGLVGGYAVRDARTRGTLVVAGFAVGIVQALAAFLSSPVLSQDVLSNDLRPFFISGIFSAAVVLATSKVFEYLFGELTNFSLLELSDSLNQPLLRRMAFEAPGTYHHSLVLSNLAGAAADAIGANALLARVGSYYHDIGKIDKPEYFTENQMMSDNKHDHLEPSMSRLVIFNHVREGVEIARRHKLSPKIIDFIEQHHGTSTIHYFYQKALQDAVEHSDVKEENFRYPGPKPQTKEVAIVMLADSVEGATRALDEQTPTRIKETVRRVINNKFIDGQLDECGLTLREIEMVSENFSKVLSAMYHVRVKYPEAKKNGH
jgi:putative nucleotidyltransferase with HDIG domain